MANNFEILRAGGESETMIFVRRNEKESDLSNKNLSSEESDLNNPNPSSKDFLERKMEDSYSSENLSNFSQSEEPIEDPSGMTEYFDTKVNLMISTVQDFFPNISSEFVMKCLQYYKYSVEEVLDAIIGGDLPPSLDVLDRGMEEELFENFVMPSSGSLHEEPSKNCSSQLEKLPEIENWADEADFTEFQSMSSEEIEATVSGIEEIYPELGREFIKECLKYYDYSDFEVLEAITEDNWPPFLEFVYKTTREHPVNSMSTQTLCEESKERSSSQVGKDINLLNKSKKEKPFLVKLEDVDEVNESDDDTETVEVTEPPKTGRFRCSGYGKDVPIPFRNWELYTIYEE